MFTSSGPRRYSSKAWRSDSLLTASIVRGVGRHSLSVGAKLKPPTCKQYASQLSSLPQLDAEHWPCFAPAVHSYGFC